MTGVLTEVRLIRGGLESVSADSFALAQRPMPEPGPGEALIRIRAVSLDPYQRIRMRGLEAGSVPPAGCFGQVVASRAPHLPDGAWVTGELGWADHAAAPASALTRVVADDPRIPAHAHVGLLGLSGITAYFGTTRVLRPEPGERIVVSGAYGGVGQVALQIARLRGAEVLGIVSSADKLAALGKHALAAVDRSHSEWTDALDAWAPDGVDGYFDNVWGEVASRVVERLRPLGRIALCGQMTGLAAGRVPPLDIDWYLILTRSLTLQGFRAVDYPAEYDAARAQLAEWYLAGRLTQDVNIVDGLAGAPAAFEALLAGRTLGKTVVEIS